VAIGLGPLAPFSFPPLFTFSHFFPTVDLYFPATVAKRLACLTSV
jgi:hypothetical protein